MIQLKKAIDKLLEQRLKEEVTWGEPIPGIKSLKRESHYYNISPPQVNGHIVLEFEKPVDKNLFQLKKNENFHEDSKGILTSSGYKPEGYSIWEKKNGSMTARLLDFSSNKIELIINGEGKKDSIRERSAQLLYEYYQKHLELYSS
jgi:hypothetical protein